ncbi:MAG: T9SS type A sorting domain-containing protein [Bacteroidales bacterium]|nr:T9SS type A sorting domain-containing protein [Bacteroidales bacterium]
MVSPCTPTPECLIENNVFEHLRHAMMVKTGANGNVFADNYSIDPHRSETISDYSGDISLHGHYAYANLFEGNIAQNIFIDHYRGPSGPYNTFFRNRAELYGFVITTSDNATDQQNIAGLEVTNTNFLYGMYTLNGSDHFEYGNYVTGDIVPVETDSLPDTSYYLSGLPSFWTQGLPWPSIGVPLEAGTYDIPAKQRHLGLNTMAGTRHYSALAIAPSPARSQITFSGWGEGPVTIIIFDLQGNKVLVQKKSNKRSLAVSHLESGAYIITFQDEKRFAAKKVFIVR